VNHKRVARIMREDHLLAIGRRQFVVTTESGHGLEVALNLARRLKLTGINQLWVADITLYPVVERVRVSGGSTGRLLAQGWWAGS